jgi:hypothetical protein
MRIGGPIQCSALDRRASVILRNLRRHLYANVQLFYYLHANVQLYYYLESTRILVLKYFIYFIFIVVRARVLQID